MTLMELQPDTGLLFGPLASAIEQSLMNNRTNPLDKVYGIYGLLPGCLNDLPPINYTIDKRALYEAFTRATIGITGKFWPAVLPVLAERDSNLPSWVPDLSIHVQVIDPEFEFEDGHPGAAMRVLDLLHHGRENIIEIVPVSSPGAFSLRGTLLSHVGGVADRRWPRRPEELGDCYWSWCQFISAAEKAFKSNPKNWPYDPWVAFNRLLLDDLEESEKKRARSFGPKLNTWEGIRKWLESYDSGGPTARWNSMIMRSMQSKGGLVYSCRRLVGKKFEREASLFTTAAGHLGFGFGKIEHGDVIALLTGCDEPVILRKHGENWRLIGRVPYIHGDEFGSGWREQVCRLYKSDQKTKCRNK
jgi:hypothetical protein